MTQRRLRSFVAARWWPLYTILVLATDHAQAMDLREWLGDIDWSIHGFLSQGFILTSGNNLFGSSRDGSFDLTEIGVNGAVRPFPNLHLSTQGLYRRAGGSDEEGLRLDYLLLDYSYPVDKTGSLGLRLGRVKNPFGFYNETRDVTWTRPSILLPQSIYFDALGLRQPMISSDGGLLYASYALGDDHQFDAEFLVSEPNDNAGGTVEFLIAPNVQGELEGRPMFIGRFGYNWAGGRGRLMFSVLDLDRDFRSKTSSVPSGKLTAFFPLLSGQYNAEHWSLTSEYGLISTVRSGFVPGGGSLKNTSESYYFQGTYRITPTWSVLARYDAFFVNRDDRNGRRAAAQTGSPRHRFFAKDWMLGTRWEFARNFLVAAEYHYIDGTAWLSARDNPDLVTGGGKRRWELFALMLSFRF
jgi:hypothetical protein